VAGRFLVSDARDLAGHRDGHQPRRDHEHEPEVRGRAAGRPPEPLDGLLDPAGAAERRPCRLGDEAEDETRHRERQRPRDHRRTREPDRETGLPAQQEGPRPGALPALEDARTQVAPSRNPHGQHCQHDDQGPDRHEAEGRGPGQRTELLDPAERARPPQPAEPAVRIGSHPDQIGRGEHARADQIRATTGCGELPGEQPDRHEHRG
jgi:hypothetical protein